MKDIGVKISNRKSKNSVLSSDDVLNDINDYLGKENGGNSEIGDNIGELCGEKEENDSNPSEQCFEEEQQSGEPEDNINRQQRYWTRKQLTCNRNVHNIDSCVH